MGGGHGGRAAAGALPRGLPLAPAGLRALRLAALVPAALFGWLAAPDAVLAHDADSHAFSAYLQCSAERVSEGDSLTATVVTVDSDGAPFLHSGYTTRFTVDTVAGTAGNDDYQELDGAVFARNHADGLASFTIPIKEDDVREPDETFTIRISGLNIYDADDERFDGECEITIAGQVPRGQFSNPLVANTGQSHHTTVADASVRQAFTTGTHPHGYSVSDVGVSLGAGGDDSPASSRVRIHSDSNGTPGSVLATLGNPATFEENSVNRFEAQIPVALEALTQYWIVTSGLVGQSLTASGAEDGGTRAGWAIADRALRGASENGTEVSPGRCRCEDLPIEGELGDDDYPPNTRARNSPGGALESGGTIPSASH